MAFTSQTRLDGLVQRVADAFGGERLSGRRQGRPPDISDVAGYLLALSRDTAAERVTGIEPAQSAWKA